MSIINTTKLKLLNLVQNKLCIFMWCKYVRSLVNHQGKHCLKFGSSLATNSSHYTCKLFPFTCRQTDSKQLEQEKDSKQIATDNAVDVRWYCNLIQHTVSTGGWKVLCKCYYCPQIVTLIAGHSLTTFINPCSCLYYKPLVYFSKLFLAVCTPAKDGRYTRTKS